MPNRTAEFAGCLKYPVTVQTFTETRSGRGAAVETPTTYATCFMEKTDLAGREFFDARQVFAEVTTRWRCRYIPGLRPKMQIVDADGVVYDIVAVTDPEGLRREQDILTVLRGA